MSNIESSFSGGPPTQKISHTISQMINKGSPTTASRKSGPQSSISQLLKYRKSIQKQLAMKQQRTKVKPGNFLKKNKGSPRAIMGSNSLINKYLSRGSPSLAKDRSRTPKGHIKSSSTLKNNKMRYSPDYQSRKENYRLENRTMHSPQYHGTNYSTSSLAKDKNYQENRMSILKNLGFNHFSKGSPGLKPKKKKKKGKSALRSKSNAHSLFQDQIFSPKNASITTGSIKNHPTHFSTNSNNFIRKSKRGGSDESILTTISTSAKHFSSLGSCKMRGGGSFKQGSPRSPSNYSLKYLLDVNKYRREIVEAYEGMKVTFYCINHQNKRSKFYAVENERLLEASNISLPFSRGLCSNCAVHLGNHNFKIMELEFCQEKEDIIKDYSLKLTKAREYQRKVLKASEKQIDVLKNHYQPELEYFDNFEQGIDSIVEMLLKEKERMRTILVGESKAEIEKFENIRSVLIDNISYLNINRDELEDQAEEMIKELSIKKLDNIFKEKEEELEAMVSKIRVNVKPDFGVLKIERVNLEIMRKFGQEMASWFDFQDVELSVSMPDIYDNKNSQSSLFSQKNTSNKIPFQLHKPFHHSQLKQKNQLESEFCLKNSQQSNLQTSKHDQLNDKRIEASKSQQFQLEEGILSTHTPNKFIIHSKEEYLHKDEKYDNVMEFINESDADQTESDISCQMMGLKHQEQQMESAKEEDIEIMNLERLGKKSRGRNKFNSNDTHDKINDLYFQQSCHNMNSTSEAEFEDSIHIKNDNTNNNGEISKKNESQIQALITSFGKDSLKSQSLREMEMPQSMSSLNSESQEFSRLRKSSASKYMPVLNKISESQQETNNFYGPLVGDNSSIECIDCEDLRPNQLIELKQGDGNFAKLGTPNFGQDGEKSERPKHLEKMLARNNKRGGINSSKKKRHELIKVEDEISEIKYVENISEFHHSVGNLTKSETSQFDEILNYAKHGTGSVQHRISSNKKSQNSQVQSQQEQGQEGGSSCMKILFQEG